MLKFENNYEKVLRNSKRVVSLGYNKTKQMKKGRVNERNTGFWSLDGELKRRSITNRNTQPLTPDQEAALLAADHISQLLRSHRSGYYSYLIWDMDNEIIAHWAKNGIIQKGIRPSLYGCDPKEICVLNEDQIEDLTMVKDLLVSFFHLEDCI